MLASGESLVRHDTGMNIPVGWEGRGIQGLHKV